MNRVPAANLTPERLGLSPGATVDAYLEGLRQHYPTMPDNADLDIIDFVIGYSAE